MHVATVDQNDLYEMFVNTKSVWGPDWGTPVCGGTVNAWDSTGLQSILPTGYNYVYDATGKPAGVNITIEPDGDVMIDTNAVSDFSVNYWIEDSSGKRVSNIAALQVTTGYISSSPTAVALHPDANTGSTDFANLTITQWNNATGCRLLRFTAIGVKAGATIRVHDDLGRMLVEGTVAPGNTQIDLQATVEQELLDGFHRITVTQQEVGKAESEPVFLDLLIDTHAPETPFANPLDLYEYDDSGMSPRDNVTNALARHFHVLSGTSLSSVKRALPGNGFYSELLQDSDFTEISDTYTQEGIYRYQVSALDLAGNASALSSDFTVTVDTTAPTTTPTIDLIASSDLGFANNDDITSDPTPTFSMTGTEFAYRVTRDSVQISGDYERFGNFDNWDPTFWIPADTDVEGLVTGQGAWVDRNTPANMEDWYTYAVSAVDLAGNAASTAGQMQVFVDRVAPTKPNVSEAETSDLDLNPLSDAGPYNDDEITNLTTLNFGVTYNNAFPDSEYYRINRDGTQVSDNYETSQGFLDDKIETDYGTTTFDNTMFQYTLIAVDLAGNTTHSDPLNVTVDTIAPPAPLNGLSLQSGSDTWGTGGNNIDNETNAASLTFDVSINDACHFRVQRDGTVIGDLFNLYSNGATWTDPAAPSSTVDWSAGYISPLEYTVAQVDRAGNVSGYSPAEQVLVDRAGPAYEFRINGGNNQRHTLDTIQVFLTDGATITGGDLEIFKDTGSGWQDVTPANILSLFDPATNTWDVSGLLTDSTYYTARIAGTAFANQGLNSTDLAGNSWNIDLVTHFHRFDYDMDGSGGVSQGDVDMFYAAIAAGTNDPLYDIGSYDANGDPQLITDGSVTIADAQTLIDIIFDLEIGDMNVSGGVDLEDFILLKSNFGMDDPTWSDGDIDYDGDIDLNDFVLLKTNFGLSSTLAALASMTQWT